MDRLFLVRTHGVGACLAFLLNIGLVAAFELSFGKFEPVSFATMTVVYGAIMLGVAAFGAHDFAQTRRGGSLLTGVVLATGACAAVRYLAFS